MQNKVPARTAMAVDRRMGARHQAAMEEAERILVAALRVMERSYPESARIADVVAEAGTSNQTFYRYFASKAELTLAVMERGIGRVVTYLEHQMAKEREPRRRVAAWIEGVLAQVTDVPAAKASLATLAELGRIEGVMAHDSARTVVPLRDLLLQPLEAAGSSDPQRDADAVYEAAFGTMRRHLFSGTRPEPADVDHLTRFCLAGLDAGRGAAPDGA